MVVRAIRGRRGGPELLYTANLLASYYRCTTAHYYYTSYSSFDKAYNVSFSLARVYEQIILCKTKCDCSQGQNDIGNDL